MRRAVFAGLLAAGSLLLAAATVGVPGLFVTSPTGAEIIRVEGSGPQIEVVYLTQLRDTAGYTKQVPVTGATFQTPPNTSVIQATPAGTLAAWTVLTPVSPQDGQRLLIFTTQTVTTFNLTASAGQTVNGNLAGSLAANSHVEYLYSASNSTWDRIQ